MTYNVQTKKTKGYGITHFNQDVTINEAAPVQTQQAEPKATIMQTIITWIKSMFTYASAWLFVFVVVAIGFAIHPLLGVVFLLTTIPPMLENHDE